MILKLKNTNLTNIKEKTFLIDNLNLNVNKTVVSSKISFDKNGFKYFIDYKDVKKIRPFRIFLPKMSALLQRFW